MTRMQVRVDGRRGRIDEALFKVFGCSAAIASASLVAERLRGAALDEARGLEAVAMAAELELPMERARRGGAGGRGGEECAVGGLGTQTMIEITESAARVIARQLAKNGLDGGGLRVAVKAGGCSGYSYVFKWDAARAAPTRCSRAPAARRMFVDPRSLTSCSTARCSISTRTTCWPPISRCAIRTPRATCGCGESSPRDASGRTRGLRSLTAAVSPWPQPTAIGNHEHIN